MPEKLGQKRKKPGVSLPAQRVNFWGWKFRSRAEGSPILSQLDSCFVERGTLSLKRLERRPVIVLRPWYAHSDEKPESTPARKERPDGMKLARHYQALLDSGKFENRAALARHLGVSRARVTQVLRRLVAEPAK
ncbi:MAG: hypothetical protein LC104_09630 [Bacteroidales bacterium]|nr:hypothetical protein [Bacteroidales bacterium]